MFPGFFKGIIQNEYLYKCTLVFKKLTMWTHNLCFSFYFSSQEKLLLKGILVRKNYYIMIRGELRTLTMCATRNFSGQLSFLGMRTLWYTFYLEHTKERSHREKFWSFFLLGALKNALQMKYLTHRWAQSGYFFLKSRYLFSIFKKGQAR